MSKQLLFAAALSLIISIGAQAAPTNDDFIAGFASAVLEHDFRLQNSTISVDHGVVTLLSKEVGTADRDRIIAAMKQIKGVTEVRIVDATPTSEPAQGGQGVETNLQPLHWTFFAPTNVFAPLLADPRWPNFSAAYDRSIGHNDPHADIANVSFGESLSFFQDSPTPHDKFEVGIQAAVFATFDLDSASKDLVNADYFAGPIAEYRHDDFSAIFRVFHQSSHLGDEFLLDHPGFTRINLSYEEASAIVSYDLFDKSVRVYAGGGYLVDVDPSNLKPGVVQYGIEYRGPRIWPNTAMIPIAALDIQNRQMNNWSGDISARAGVEFQNPAAIGRKVDLMLEYYNGHSPNGQFNLDKIQTIGLGLHFYL